MDRKKLIKSEVVKMFNTSSETLRHYEQKGLLKPEVLENQYRQYDFHDLQKLRQIMMFRELGLSINEIKDLDSGKLAEKDYENLLENHQQALEDKICRLTETNENIKQLLSLLKEKSTHTFNLRHFRKRFFILLERIESEVMKVPKKYFDAFRSIIESDFYTESTLQLVYPYKELKDSVVLSSKIAIEIPVDQVTFFKEHNNSDLMEFCGGTYLSVFYSFEHGNFEPLADHHKIIETYLKNNHLKRIGEMVLEKEHPELSLYLGENVTMYELQIQVEKEIIT